MQIRQFIQRKKYINYDISLNEKVHAISQDVKDG